ncbi:2-dehydropantoate 2-reductase [Chelatococcus reniformis]|uniref:2-dehydropantoate 2-reductase n=1 Tax=Chelatococcus reniformis TaxID=1494448 RepID=A0A916U468_9HYPH|nr:2-dehydropantoate 2-reductase [Chelatococcus reniformis]GGC60004.1 2-dehydropantoate 2-reductase [Chelatococcus reniformis]
MRMLVVGAGSTGGYFGGRLAAAGREVTFLVRPQRAAKLAAQGLEVISPRGNLSLQPKLITADTLDVPFDVVLLAVKAYALETALNDLAPAVGPQTMIVPVLNGMRHMDVLAERFGAGRLVGGVARIASTLDPHGRIMHLAPFHDISYGELDGSISPRISALDAFMQGAGFDARLSMAIEREMWEKWAFLSSLGAITCLMRGTVGEVEAAPGGRACAEQLIDEVAAVIGTAGIGPSEAFLAQVRGQLTAKGSPLTSSMYRDLVNGSPIEADQIVGDLLARGTRAGVATPLLAAAYAHLAIHQARLAP